MSGTGCIYQVRNLLNGKCYIGKTRELSHRKSYHHWQAKAGHQSLLHRAIRKYGRAMFEWRILFVDIPHECLDELEKWIIAERKTQTPNGYNMTSGGEGGATLIGRQRDPETRRKIGDAQIGRNKGKTLEEIHGEEKGKALRLKLSNVAKGRVFSEQHKLRLSEAATGRKLTDEQKKKLSASLKKTMSRPEVKKRLSDGQKRRKRKTHSKETRRKMSESNKKRWARRIWTEADHTKMSEAQKRRPPITDTARQNMSAAQKKRIPYRHTSQSKEAMRAAQQRRHRWRRLSQFQMAIKQEVGLCIG